MGKYELGYCIVKKAIQAGVRTQEEVNNNTCTFCCDDCNFFGFRGLEGKKAQNEYERHLKK